MALPRGLLASSVLLLLGGLVHGCAGDAASTELDVYVDRHQCAAPSRCNERFEISVVCGDCVCAWATKVGDGDLVFESLGLEQGVVQVAATCDVGGCAHCAAAAPFTTERRVDLLLDPLSSCAAPSVVTAPCAECGPAEGAYCDGNRRVTCVDGTTQSETCPEGCVAGACTTCPKKTYYRDVDGDSYGNPEAKIEACEQPPGTVTNDRDCDDSDAEAHPEQSEWFARPTLGTERFDFNCDDVEERKITDVLHCTYADGRCVGDGWREPVPECGKLGTYVECLVLIPFVCVPKHTSVQQVCR